MRLITVILGSSWLIFVASWYFQYHNYYKSSWVFTEKGLLILLLWAILCTGVWAIHKWKNRSHLVLSPVRIFVSSLVFITLTATTLYGMLDLVVFTGPYNLVFYENNEFAVIDEATQLTEGVKPNIYKGAILSNWSEGKEMFPEELQSFFVQKPLISFALNFFLTLSKIFFAWLGFLILFYGLGAWTLPRKETQHFSWPVFFKATGLGMGLLMAILFGLGVFSLLTRPMVIGVTLALFAFSLFKAKPLLHAFWNTRWPLSLGQIQTRIPVLGVLIFFLSFNLMDWSPVPVGFDSLHRYHNTPNLLTQYQHLVPGWQSYNFEFINSLPLFLFNDTMISLSLTVLVGLLGLAFTFYLFSRYASWKESLVLIAVWMSLPMMNFMMHIDLKTDLPLLFFSLLALYESIEWWKHREEKKAAHSHLIYAGLFLGIAFGIKYTVSLLIITLFAFYAYAFTGTLGLWIVSFLGVSLLSKMGGITMLQYFSEKTQQQMGWILLALGIVAFGGLILKTTEKKKLLQTFLIPAGIMALVFSPWLIKNAVESKSLDPEKLLYGQSQAIVVKAEEFGEVNSQFCQAAIHYDEEDWGRYTGHYEGPFYFEPLVLLWESTINSGLSNNRLTDISFLFLGFVVFGILSWKQLKKQGDQLPLIMRFTVTYGVLWLLSSQGVIWYGLPLFLGILLFYGALWKKEKWMVAVVGFWFLMSMSLRFSDAVTENAALLYAGGVTDKNLNQEQRITGSVEMAEILNAPEVLDKNVYLVGTFMTYYIDQNDRRVYWDQTLNDFDCAFRNVDPLVTLDRLHQKGFRYIVFSKKALEIEANPNGPLHEQFEWFEHFAKDNLKEVLVRHNVVLYEIPDA